MVWVPWVCIPITLAINVVAYLCNPNSWPRCWHQLDPGKARAVRLLGISNRAQGVGREQPPSCFWAWGLLDPDHCVESLFVPAWALLALRILGLLFFASYFFVKEFADHDLKPNWLTFFTNWSFVVFALSMLLGAAQSAAHLWRQQRMRGCQQRQRLPSGPTAAAPYARGASSGAMGAAAADPEPGDATEGRELLAAADLDPHRGAEALDSTEAPGHEMEDGRVLSAVGSSDRHVPGIDSCGACQPGAPAVASWGPLAKAHLLSAEVACSSELFLTVFYWALLYSGSPDDLASNLMVHGINNVFMLADVALSRLPFVSFHFQAVLAYGTAYLIFMWINFGASGAWTYSTLDWSKGSSFVYYLLLPCLLALAFFFYLALAWLRERLGAWLAQRATGSRALGTAAAALELPTSSAAADP